jgi:cation diffusion facilitator CzcD-associated flavoprotein CzcO
MLTRAHRSRYWNRYPGARVDSEYPFYQVNIPEVYEKWNFSQRFSDHAELRQYFKHIDKTLDLRKDVTFKARVNDASWDQSNHQWTVKTLQGHTATAKYLVLCTGLLHRTYTPDFPGLSEYKGEVYHSGAWPEDYSGKGKKIAIIGAGATAVQITQELGKQADELTVFLRRPSYCLPIGQRKLSDEEQIQMKAYFHALFNTGRKSRAGFPVIPREDRVQDVDPATREAIFEGAWQSGGFAYLFKNFSDVLLDKEANLIVYDFWKRKVRERLSDPRKQTIMAPDEPPYYFGTKRAPLELDYYDVMNQPNVSVHDLKAVPLKSFHEKGLVMADDSLKEFDTIVLATGFDSYTGSLTQMGLKNKDGVDLKDIWANEGVRTYIGLTISGFPNMFMSYTPQAPTALSNGTTIIEAQIETIVDMVAKLEKEGAETIEATPEAEKEWTEMCRQMASYTLIPTTDSWW